MPFAAILGLLAALVLLLYLLRPPPRLVVVVSIRPWQELMQRRGRRRRLWRWLRSLLLSILIAAAIAAAWARVELGGNRLRRPLLVLDNSATMAARAADGTSRLDQALRSARRAVGAASVPITLADTTGTFGRATFDTRAEALRALDDWPRSFSLRARWPDAELDARPNESIGHVVLWSDLVAPLEAPEKTLLVDLSAPLANVALTHFASSTSPGIATQVFVELLYEGARPAQIELEVTRVEGGASLARQRLDLAPGDRWSGAVDLDDLGASRIVPLRAEVRLLSVDGPPGGESVPSIDGIAGDDVAWTVARQWRPLRVDLRCLAATALERALAADPSLQAWDPRRQRAAPDVVVSCTRVDERETLPVLLIAPETLPGFLGSATRLESSEVINGYFATRHFEPVRLEGISVADWTAWSPQDQELAETRVLWSHDAGPLAFLLPRPTIDAAPIAVWAFDPESSNLAHRPELPVLLRQTLLALTDRPTVVVADPGLIRLPAGTRLTGSAQPPDARNASTFPWLRAGLFATTGPDGDGWLEIRPAPAAGARINGASESALQRLDTEQLDPVWTPPWVWIAVALALVELVTRMRGWTE